MYEKKEFNLNITLRLSRLVVNRNGVAGIKKFWDECEGYYYPLEVRLGILLPPSSRNEPIWQELTGCTWPSPPPFPPPPPTHMVLLIMSPDRQREQDAGSLRKNILNDRPNYLNVKLKLLWLCLFVCWFVCCLFVDLFLVSLFVSGEEKLFRNQEIVVAAGHPSPPAGGGW